MELSGYLFNDNFMAGEYNHLKIRIPVEMQRAVHAANPTNLQEFWDAAENAFQAERHIMLQKGQIKYGKLANIKTRVNNTKFTKKDSRPRKNKQVSIKNIDTNYQQADRSNKNCFKCGKPGHFAKNCYSKTKIDSFNSWKLKGKSFCSKCGKKLPYHASNCTRNNRTHMNGKYVGTKRTAMELGRYKNKGKSYQKERSFKGKKSYPKGKFTKKKFRHYDEGNEEESDEDEFYSQEETSEEESDEEETITANNINKNIKKKIHSFT